MSSKPQAPLTAHLRKRLLRTSEEREKPRRKRPRAEPHPLFVSNGLHEWIEITPEVVQNLKIPPSPQIPTDCVDDNRDVYTVTETDKMLCHVLEVIAAKHDPSNRFLAMTAKLAIRLVHIGKTDDINPGLWPHISEMEEELGIRIG